MMDFIVDFITAKANQRYIFTSFIEFYRSIESMQLKLKRILCLKQKRVEIIAKMWTEEVKEFFMSKCLSNKNSKYYRRFKRLSIPIATVSIDIKVNLITKYLQMRTHLNSAIFFKNYGESHPEFDSKEQIEKRK